MSQRKRKIDTLDTIDKEENNVELHFGVEFLSPVKKSKVRIRILQWSGHRRNEIHQTCRI